MKKIDFNDYKNKYEMISDIKHCYCGNNDCSSCMHCFPGNYISPISNYDGKDVCLMERKEVV